MSIWKLVSGLLSIVLSVLIFAQSALAGLANTLAENEEVGGSAGVIVSVLLLVTGILFIVTRKSSSKGGNIAVIILTAIASAVGFGGAGSYSDLKIWSAWCLLLLLTAILSLVLGKKQRKAKTKDGE